MYRIDLLEHRVSKNIPNRISGIFTCRTVSQSIGSTSSLIHGPYKSWLCRLGRVNSNSIIMAITPYKRRRRFLRRKVALCNCRDEYQVTIITHPLLHTTTIIININIIIIIIMLALSPLSARTFLLKRIQSRYPLCQNAKHVLLSALQLK